MSYLCSLTMVRRDNRGEKAAAAGGDENQIYISREFKGYWQKSTDVA
jgi:hypothetical protein